ERLGANGGISAIVALLDDPAVLSRGGERHLAANAHGLVDRPMVLSALEMIAPFLSPPRAKEVLESVVAKFHASALTDAELRPANVSETNALLRRADKLCRVLATLACLPPELSEQN